MNDLGIGNHMRQPLPVRPLLPHTPHAYAHSAVDIFRDAIPHEHGLSRGDIQSLQCRHEDLWVGLAHAEVG